MTHKQTIALRDAKVQARLLCLLDRNSDWLSPLCYKTGLQWLHASFGYDPRLERALEGDGTFWNWWKNAWRQRDEDINNRLKVLVNNGPPVLAYTTKALSEAGRGATVFFHSPDEFRPFYLGLHKPAAIMPSLQLPPVVLEQVKRDIRTKELALNTL